MLFKNEAVRFLDENSATMSLFMLVLKNLTLIKVGHLSVKKRLTPWKLPPISFHFPGSSEI